MMPSYKPLISLWSALLANAIVAISVDLDVDVSSMPSSTALVTRSGCLKHSQVMEQLLIAQHLSISKGDALLLRDMHARRLPWEVFVACMRGASIVIAKDPSPFLDVTHFTMSSEEIANIYAFSYTSSAFA